MNEAEFHAEKMYLLCLGTAKAMLKKGVISEEEFTKIDRLYSYNDCHFTNPCLFRPWPHQIRAYNLLMAGNVRNIPGFLPKTSPERE